MNWICTSSDISPPHGNIKIMEDTKNAKSSLKWTNLKDHVPPKNTEVVLIYREDSGYFEAQVIHEKNLSQCDWGEAYWILLPPEEQCNEVK